MDYLAKSLENRQNKVKRLYEEKWLTTSDKEKKNIQFKIDEIESGMIADVS